MLEWLRRQLILLLAGGRPVVCNMYFRVEEAKPSADALHLRASFYLPRHAITSQCTFANLWTAVAEESA